MIYVIGSGPAGVSAAYALVKKGVEITMLDAGIQLEPNAKKIVDKLKKSEHWDQSLIKKIKEKAHERFGKDIIKYVYGSDYPYREVNKHMPIKTHGVSYFSSFGKGGLSAAWGAAVMPYLDGDLTDWPISIKDLEPHYRAVLKFMNIAAAKDDLADIFPLYTDNYQAFQFSKQALSFLEDLNKNKENLKSRGFIFGSSRLAVQFNHTKKKPGCVYCGLCMYGCPYELIYNSAFTVEDLKKYKNFHYVKDVIVKKVVESGKKVKIIAKNKINGNEKIYEGSHIFLGCGALSTTKIILESLQAYNQQVILRDTQHFLLPFLRYKGVSDVTNEKLHALSQIYLEIFDKKIDPHSIHLQVYTYNDFFDVELKNKFGPFYNILKKLLYKFVGRVIVLQGFIHSKSSSSISVKLKKDPSSTLILKKIKNRSRNKKIRAIILKFLKNRKYFRMTPIIPLLKISKPGGSAHYGGSFPMRKNPNRLESDILGRPYGFKRTYMIDSSTFPSIPTQTITLTIMANSHRIASMYDKVQQK